MPAKCQLEMVDCFRALETQLPAAWELICAGVVESTDYFQQVSLAASRAKVTMRVDLPFSELRLWYGRAKIFWHAMGLHSAVEQREPSALEHFGMSTVEAMAAGCVPVVIDRGGQREIVEHGKSGFLWNTVEELKYYTLRLVFDDALRDRMSLAAIVRARRFSVDNFLYGFRARLSYLA
jgi:glycosyltransferase involved in cell wall biosynthesis